MQIYTVTFNPHDTKHSAYTVSEIFATLREAEEFVQTSIAKCKVVGNYWTENNYEIGAHTLPAATILACHEAVLCKDLLPEPEQFFKKFREER